MVFLALPALQASQRDTARRESVISFIDKLKKFQSNNSRGALPGTNKEQETLDGGKELKIFDEDTKDKLDALSWGGFYRDYFNSNNFQDPNGGGYDWYIVMCNKSSKPSEACANKLTINGNETTLDNLENTKFYDNVGVKDDKGRANNWMYVVTSAVCDGGKAVKSANTRNVAALYHLEGGGVYCENT